MLVWAGFVEAFLSQYHEPVIPYEAKIAFGLVELTLLCLFLGRSGRKSSEFKRVPRVPSRLEDPERAGGQNRERGTRT